MCVAFTSSSPLPVQPGRKAARTTPTTCSLYAEGRVSRRAALTLLAGAAAGVLWPKDANLNTALAKPAGEQSPTQGFITRTGLKYVDFNEGTGKKPEWGDYVRLHYVAYSIKPDGSALVKEDSTYGLGKNVGFLIHHGNGEMILGLEEAVHTMREGGRRRAIIPFSLGYNKSDLGPVPLTTQARRRFSNHIDESDGTVVFDIELLEVTPDIDDRGYYKDIQPDEEEELEIATRARKWYADKLKEKGLEPPDVNTPISEYTLGPRREYPYSPYVAPGLKRPDIPPGPIDLQGVFVPQPGDKPGE